MRDRLFIISVSTTSRKTRFSNEYVLLGKI